MAPGGAAAASASARILSLYSAVKVRRLASATTSGSGRGGLGGSGVTVLPAAVLRSFSLRSSSLRSAAGKTVGEAEDIPLFFTLIPVLALLSNYDRENCLINVGTEGKKRTVRPSAPRLLQIPVKPLHHLLLHVVRVDVPRLRVNHAAKLLGLPLHLVNSVEYLLELRHAGRRRPSITVAREREERARRQERHHSFAVKLLEKPGNEVVNPVRAQVAGGDDVLIPRKAGYPDHGPDPIVDRRQPPRGRPFRPSCVRTARQPPQGAKTDSRAQSARRAASCPTASPPATG